MNHTLFHRIGAAAVFAFALILYFLTVSPTVSFWDPGERIAVSHGLQIPHPPGAPFYMLVGRLFSMFVPATYAALAVNMISVLASAFTVLLAYWIIHMLIRAWKPPREEWTLQEHVVALGGAAVGSLTLAVSDTFWFNALEAETYAFSTFFTALCVFVALKWREQAQRTDARLPGDRQHVFGSGAERWLLLIAYLYGLAIGVHLLSLLSLFFVALIVYFQHFERADGSLHDRIVGLAATAGVASAGFLALYPGIIQVLPQLARQSGAPVLFFVALVAAVAFGVYYTHTHKMRVANLALLCVAFVLIGFSSYALIVIRSAANPPIDQNDPENVDAFISYMTREQYGHTPLLKGATFDNRIGQIDPDRETLFPRRHSALPEHMQLYAQYNSDWEFFWHYQVGHMYVRYLLWNFVGRSSDIQEAPAITGFRFVDGDDRYLRSTPSEEASRKAYYALPFLLGLMGAAFHFRSDWRRALAVAVLFFMTSIGIILYLNQTPFQPRERDYSYAGSFFAFSLWIGIGAAGILQLTLDAVRMRLNSAARLQTGALAVVGGLLLLAVPVCMGVQNYADHDRSGNYVARDYAYNLLMSTDENAVLFTNGDNDTFPLWYLQEVEGVRRDVRVANLSLLNTRWYARQLKNQWSRDSPPVPISQTDPQINQLNVVAWQPRVIQLPIEQRADFVVDGDLPEAVQDPGEFMEWRLEGRPYPFAEDVNILYAADQMVLDVVRTNAMQGWTRPIYFATTVSPDNQLDLHEHLQLEGMAFRVVPVRRTGELDRVDGETMLERLQSFRFTGLDDPGVYFDANIRRMVDQYRIIFSRAAQALVSDGDRESAHALLETLMANVPFDTIPGNESSIWSMARAYHEVGERETAADVLARAEPVVLHRLAQSDSMREVEYATSFARLILATYVDIGRLDDASNFTQGLADVTGNASFFMTPDELRREFGTAGAGPNAPPG